MGKRVLIVGATGTLGRAVARDFATRAEVIEVGHTHGSRQVDITDSASIRALFETVGNVDAIVSVTGKVHYGLVTETTAEQFRVGLNDKLLGQIELALVGQRFLNDGGSITLTSGIVAQQPIRMGSNMSTVNAALEGFAMAAAGELARGQRINVVSPTLLEDAVPVYGPFFAGFEPVPGERVALAYVRSVEGIETGKVYRVW
jgi:NAD(P)-dependent dehydrogenase (short-subunit alcohol dehydrogenase family)